MNIIPLHRPTKTGTVSNEEHERHQPSKWFGCSIPLFNKKRLMNSVPGPVIRPEVPPEFPVFARHSLNLYSLHRCHPASVRMERSIRSRQNLSNQNLVIIHIPAILTQALREHVSTKSIHYEKIIHHHSNIISCNRLCINFIK